MPKGSKLHVLIMPSGQEFTLTVWTDVQPGEGIGFKDKFDPEKYPWNAVSCDVTYA